MTKVSVVIPTIGRPTLERAVESLINQTFCNWELIIVNDNQTNPIELNIDNPKIKYFENEKTSGANGARNTGIEKSTGEYIAFLDDDDEWHKHKLEFQIKMMESNNVIMSYTGRNIIEGTKSPRYVYRSKFVSPKLTLFFHNYIGTTSTIVIRKEVLNKIDGFDERLNSVQDYDLYLRLTDLGNVLGINSPLLTYYHQNTDHISLNIREFISSAILIFWKQKWYYKPIILVGLNVIFIQKCLKQLRRNY
jgi:glycosyltransferase involved in cell wall biosynthesis